MTYDVGDQVRLYPLRDSVRTEYIAEARANGLNNITVLESSMDAVGLHCAKKGVDYLSGTIVAIYDDDEAEDECPYKVVLSDLGDSGFAGRRIYKGTCFVWVSEYWLSMSGGVRKQLRLIV